MALKKLVYAKVTMTTPKGTLTSLFARAAQNKARSMDGKIFLRGHRDDCECSRDL